MPALTDTPALPPAPRSPRARPVIAAAQIAVRRADTPAALADNFAAHLAAMHHAADAGVDILVFPELSLTGYELDLLAAQAFTEGDARLAPLRDFAAPRRLCALIGAPLSNPQGKPHIGTLILHPGGEITRYAKQHLHASENDYAAPGEADTQVFAVGETRCAPAICYDTAHATHAKRAAQAGAALYLAGVLWSEKGYAADAADLARAARENKLTCLVANHGAPSGGYQSAGRSALWAPGGALVAAAPGTGNALLVARPQAQGWHGEIIPLK